MTGCYVLPERLEGEALISTRDDLLALRGADLELVGDAVEKLGGLALELLLGAFRTWREDGLTLRLVDPSSVLLAAMLTAPVVAPCGDPRS
jgi:anti-anti-sigma regulatory factor